jgi:hypothetical protein
MCSNCLKDYLKVLDEDKPKAQNKKDQKMNQNISINDFSD